jgi:hypothetical protein
MLTCPRCGGFVRREPATVACCICGRLGVVLDATERERALQDMLDTMLRPASAECCPEWNVPRPLGWRWRSSPAKPPDVCAYGACRERRFASRLLCREHLLEQRRRNTARYWRNRTPTEHTRGRWSARARLRAIAEELAALDAGGALT